jgi:Ca2+-binding EF-hand superfamily protein
MAAAALTALAPSAHAQSTKHPAERPTSLFHKLDANNDGKVTFEEYVSYRDTVVWTYYDPKGTGEISRKAYLAGTHARAIQFKHIDLNGDHILQKAEFDAETKRLFDRRDRNKDGILTADEFEKPQKKIGGSR